MKMKIASLLYEAEKIGGKFQIRYVDYDTERWTVPVLINQKRIADIMDDSLVIEIRIILNIVD